MVMEAKGVASERRITVEAKPSGSRAIYVVSVENILQMDALCGFFDNLSQYYHVQKLCEGQITAFALQTSRRSVYSFVWVEQILRNHFGFVSCDLQVDSQSCRDVEDLAARFQCTVTPLPKCALCGERMLFAGGNLAVYERARLLGARSYCLRCFNELSPESYDGLVAELMGVEAAIHGKEHGQVPAALSGS